MKMFLWILGLSLFTNTSLFAKKIENADVRPSVICEVLSAQMLRKVPNILKALNLAKPNEPFLVDILLRGEKLKKDNNVEAVIESDQEKERKAIHSHDVFAVKMDSTLPVFPYIRRWKELADTLVRWGVVSKERRMRWRLENVDDKIPEGFLFRDLLLSVDQLKALVKKQLVLGIGIRGIPVNQDVVKKIVFDHGVTDFSVESLFQHVEADAKRDLGANADEFIRWMSLVKRTDRGSVVVSISRILKQPLINNLRAAGLKIGKKQILQEYGLSEKQFKIEGEEQEDAEDDVIYKEPKNVFPGQITTALDATKFWVSGNAQQIFSLFTLKPVLNIDPILAPNAIDYDFRFTDVLKQLGISSKKDPLFVHEDNYTEFASYSPDQDVSLTIAAQGRSTLLLDKITELAHSKGLSTLTLENATADEENAHQRDFGMVDFSYRVKGKYAEVLKLIDELNPDYDLTNQEVLVKIQTRQIAKYLLVAEEKLRLTLALVSPRLAEGSDLTAVPDPLDPNAFYPSASIIEADPKFKKFTQHVSDAKRKAAAESIRHNSFVEDFIFMLKNVALMMKQRGTPRLLMVKRSGEFSPSAEEFVKDALFSQPKTPDSLFIQLSYELLQWAKRVPREYLEKLSLELDKGELYVTANSDEEEQTE